jgi:excisionase family DNA binding protein
MPTSRQAEAADPVLTTADAARLLGVAVSTTQLWLESGALPSWKTPGGHRRVRLSAVMGLLADDAGQAPEARTDAICRPVPAQGHPLPLDEKARLAAVAASGLAGSPPEPVFDRLTWLATQVTDCPMALVTVLTSRRQWFKSRVGVDLTETPRDWAFCSHAIMREAPLMVEDASHDARFAANPLVTGPLHVRFYAGVPLCDAAGYPLGTLCVLDREPRRLRDREVKALVELAAIAAEELRRRT